MDYKFSNYRLDTLTGTLFSQDELLKLRPKSFKVMLYLIECRDHVVSKKDLMSNIWNDVCVDDHVIFQSIAEIRSVVNDKHCIVTHPRKGYQWATSVDVVESKNSCLAKNLKPRVQAVARQEYSLWVWGIAFVSIAVSICLFALFFKSESRFPIFPGTVAVLPIVNELDEGQHSWLRLGGMELINRHLEGTRLDVFSSAKILIALKNAKASFIADPEQSAYRLRTRLGVNTIIYIRVLDSPMGYQAHFSLMNKEAFARGIVFSDDLPLLMKNVSKKISYKFNKEKYTSTHEYKNSFTEETFLKGVEHFMGEEYALAKSFLQSAHLMNPDDFDVQIFLIQNFIALEELDKAESHVNALEANSDKKNQLYNKSLLAQIEGRRGSHDKSLALLKASYLLSESFGDKLYVAMSYLELARHSAKLQDVIPAKSYFDAALKLQESFGCGYGLVAVLTEYSKLWVDRQDYGRAESLLKRALIVSDEFKLKQSKVSTLLALADIYINQKATYDESIYTAQAAHSYAIELGNKKVIELVNDWIKSNNLTESGLHMEKQLLNKP